MICKSLSASPYHVLIAIFLLVLSACSGGSSSDLPDAQPIDLTQPRVVTTTPVADATDASPGLITIIFSERVTGVDESSFLVFDLTGSVALIGNVAYDNPSRTATFTPDAGNPIRFSNNYRVTLKGAVILDDADNPLDSELVADPDYVFSFSTGDSPIVDISAGLAGNVKQHFLAVDNNGRAVSVWQQQDGTNVRIYASIFDNGNWQTETILTDVALVAGKSGVYLTGLVSNGSGFAAQWSRYDQTDNAVNNYVSIYTNANGWTGQDSSVSDGSANVRNLVLATNGNGYATVWIQSNNIRSRFYTATWSANTAVAPVSFTYGLHLASNGSGYGLVWLDEDDVDFVDVVNFDFYNSISSFWHNKTNGTPARVSLPDTDPEGTNGYSYRPRISSNGNDYALNWYGQNVVDKSSIFSAVMTGVDTQTSNIIWNGPKIISLNGNPSNNLIVSNGTGYLSAWDAVDVSNIAESYVYSNLLLSVSGTWQTAPALPPINERALGETNVPLAIGTNNGYAMVWTLAGIGGAKDEVYGRVYLNDDWQDGVLLSNASLGSKSSLTINGTGNRFIAAWTQDPGTAFPITYVNRFDGSWETGPLALENEVTTSASSAVKTVPLGNGHYLASWLKVVSPGVKRLDSKYIQAP